MYTTINPMNVRIAGTSALTAGDRLEPVKNPATMPVNPKGNPTISPPRTTVLSRGLEMYRANHRQISNVEYRSTNIIIEIKKRNARIHNEKFISSLVIFCSKLLSFESPADSASEIHPKDFEG
jgi:hypothetical protein